MQGLKLFKRKIYDEAAKCFRYANNIKYEKHAMAFSAATKGSELLSLSKDRDADSRRNKRSAIELFEKAASLFGQIDLWKLSGRCYFTIEHYSQAAESFKNERIKMRDAALSTEGPKKSDLLNVVQVMACLEGKCYWKIKNYKDAEKLFIEVNNMKMYAKTLFEAGKYDECIFFNFIFIVYQLVNKEGIEFKDSVHKLMKKYFQVKIEESNFLKEEIIKGNDEWARKLLVILYCFSERLKICIEEKIKEYREICYDLLPDYPSITYYINQFDPVDDIPEVVRQDMIETLEKLEHGDIAIYLCIFYNIADKVYETIIETILNIHNEIADIPVMNDKRDEKIIKKISKIKDLYNVAVKNDLEFSEYF